MHVLPRLVAFDVDGTLLRGETVCECIGSHLGKSEEMTLIEEATTLKEVAAARRQMLTWYLPHGKEATSSMSRMYDWLPVRRRPLRVCVYSG